MDSGVEPKAPLSSWDLSSLKGINETIHYGSQMAEPETSKNIISKTLCTNNKYCNKSYIVWHMLANIFIAS